MLGVYTIEFLKILACIIVIIVIVSLAEKLITENFYKYKYLLPKTCGKIYIPEQDIFVYIYNSKYGPCEKIKELKEKMVQIVIPIHVSNTLTKPIIRTVEAFKSALTSGIPINDAMSIIGRGSDILSTGDPTITESVKKRKWKMLIPNNFKIKCFIDKNVLYIN